MVINTGHVQPDPLVTVAALRAFALRDRCLCGLDGSAEVINVGFFAQSHGISALAEVKPALCVGEPSAHSGVDDGVFERGVELSKARNDHREGRVVVGIAGAAAA